MSRKTSTLHLIHYGSTRFEPRKFTPVCDRHFVKPNGGLWASPVDSKWGWKQWCESEGFRLAALKLSFTFTFRGSLFVIDSAEDMNRLPWIDSLHCPLFEPLQFCGYDAIHLTVKGERETRFSHPRSLYGWDCESVLILNPSCIITSRASEKNSNPKNNPCDTRKNLPSSSHSGFARRKERSGYLQNQATWPGFFDKLGLFVDTTTHTRPCTTRTQHQSDRSSPGSRQTRREIGTASSVMRSLQANGRETHSPDATRKFPRRMSISPVRSC